MPSYDFEVDLQSLAAAAQGVAETVQLFKDKDVEDLVPGEAALGSDVVWSAVEEFKDRWERGMNNLVGDVEEMGGRLGQVATNYAEFDAQGNERMTAVAGDVRAVRVMGR
ncbi:hypothetical protein [Motilibacter deserti]|uniref:Excreted virulence factor EspC (Type VII ESX diderm) n=1 Tax=Motilibacter deserti TaxID=2714956 RepID=A0ABX0GSZ1_9ACTN|nr:hypothetical protein [Motilibacter deserti]NHC12939.1 hypothetical protein [Motilibacter deserti]